MTIELPAVLKSCRDLGGVYPALGASRRRTRGDARALIDERENNLRCLDLVAAGEATLDQSLDRIEIRESDRRMRAGFDLDALCKARIPQRDALDATDLEDGQGKTTSARVVAIYRKIRDLKIKYAYAARRPRYRWGVRVRNIRKRIRLPVRHMSS